MVMDLMLSMGSGLGLFSCVEDQHQVCTSLHYCQLQKKKDCCNKNFTMLRRKTKMDVEEGNI